MATKKITPKQKRVRAHNRVWWIRKRRFADSDDGPEIPLNARLMVSISGQSNALGTDNTTALTTTQPYDGLRTIAAGTTAALVEATVTTFGETPASAMANYIRAASSRDVIVNNWAVGSTAYSGLDKGSAPYIVGSTAAITNMRNYILANRQDEIFYPAALAWIHGETDEVNGVSAATYAGFMDELQEDFEADVAALTGATNRIPLFLTQHAASGELNPAVSTLETAIGSWLAAVSNPHIYCVGPEYWGTWVANNPHINNTTARRLGRYFGRAIHEVLINGTDWKPLQPSTITATNNIVTIDFEGGDGSALVLDTTNMIRRGHFYGFDYSDGQADVPAIASVALTGSRQVQLTLTRNAQSPARVTYGNYGAVTIDPGANQQLAPGGNLRDQDATPSGDGDLSLVNWSVIFDKAIDSVTGSASSTAAFANTHSVDSTGAVRNLLSARALSTLNGQANCTWEFYLRSNAGTWPTAAQAIMGKAASGQRSFDFRTTSTAGTLRFFISTGLSDAANFHTTDASAFSGNTWYHVVVVKAGATIAVYRNGSAITITSTGTVPATMTNSTADFEILNSNDAQPAAFNMAHVSLYTRALSAADVTERYNAGTPIDPRTLSTGGPVHYWPLQQTYEDLGSGTSRNLLPFGANIAFEAIHP
jgi:hypothetical protein